MDSWYVHRLPGIISIDNAQEFESSSLEEITLQLDEYNKNAKFEKRDD